MIRELAYYLGFYLLISAIGMYLGSRKVEAIVRTQRWVKYATYVMIIVLVCASIYYRQFLWVAIIIIAGSGIELISASMRMPEKRPVIIAIAFLVFIFAALGFFLFALLGPAAVQFFIFFQVFTFDALCQITGQLFGKTPLVKKISPSKTFEGLLGGTAFCILSSILAAHWIGFSFPKAILAGIITAFSSFMGDMLASWYKRISEIKDYSRAIPGQGGFLDRFDSLMMTTSIYALFLSFLF